MRGAKSRRYQGRIIEAPPRSGAEVFLGNLAATASAPARRPSSWRCWVVCTDAVKGTGDDDFMAFSLLVSGDSKVRANGADAGTLDGFRALVLRMDIVRTIAYNCSGRGQAMPKGKAKRISEGHESAVALRPAEKAVIARAVELATNQLEQVHAGNADQAAQQVLADQVHFSLLPGQWKAFCQAPDASPRNIPALEQLLTKPSVFDELGNSSAE